MISTQVSHVVCGSGNIEAAFSRTKRKFLSLTYDKKSDVA